jgi:CRISPR-associated protein Csb2
MALAAAHFHTGSDPGERKALEWLESLPAPLLRAPAAFPRAAVTHYVPVNDKPGDRTKPPTAIIQSVPQLARDRQPRTFVRAWLEEETIYVIWPEAVAEEPVAEALQVLCGKVTRIGHSTSLVQMWVARPEEAVKPNWIPDDERMEVSLRVPWPGMLEDLERRYNAEAVEAYASLVVAAEDAPDVNSRRAARKRLKEVGTGLPAQLRPQVPFHRGYARPAAQRERAEVAGTVFSPHLIVFTLEPGGGPYQALDLRCVAAVVARWREALVSQSNDLPERVREVVSGHDRSGAPLAGPHLAFLPLAFVGHTHADGHLLGMAIVLPRGLDPEERRQVLRVLARVDELRLGELGAWRLGRDTSVQPPWNLRPEAWTAHSEGATHWATVTPVAFDRHPKAKDRGEYQREVAEMIAAACMAIRLVRPREVIVTAVSAHLGVPPAYMFPRLVRKDGGERRHAHAIVVFEEPVVGPVLIGAGRYRGYGVCRPM